MSNFRTKLLGLAAVATAFAGMSYGQITCTVAPGANPSLRSEGETELLGDLVATCNNTGAATSGTLILTTSLPITSKAVTIGVLPSNEASLTISGEATVIQGTVTGSQVSFSVPNNATNSLPAGAFTLTVQNIRVNASAATSPQVTESGVLSFATAGGSSANASVLLVGGTAYNAGFVLQSLGGTTLLAFGTTNYTACVGNPGIPTIAAPSTSFTVQIKELIGGAFKTNGSAAAGGEGGSLVGANGIGTATTATEIQLVLTNVPSAATVYVPQVVNPVGGGATTLTLSNSTAVSSGPLAGNVALTPASGTVTVLYTVTAVGSVGAQTFNVPVILQFAANAATAQSAVTVLTSYAPTGVVTGPASAIPTFAASTATAVSASKITICSTTLLFPYVTNASGFETGIAVSNTTTDNLGTIPGFPSAASPVTGTCSLNFYGNAAQPTATVTPTLGAYTAAAPTVVPVYANTLTAMIGSSGFTGYAIASCNFLEGHGFAFITDATGTFSGAMGYLATVVPSTRGENSESQSLTISITPGGGAANLGAATTATGTATGTLGLVGQ